MNVKLPALTDAHMKEVAQSILDHTHALKIDLNELKELDGAFQIEGVARFRYNLFRHQGEIGVILRIISTQVPSIESLNLPRVLQKIASFQRGLVLVTGVTGSGKSSTLAAMINYLNHHFPYHLLTIEDPVEFIHRPVKSRITQREVGTDTDSFTGALRAALRQDPDVIMVGEMRDAETIDIALKAAETGHLVLSTVHTPDAVKTIGRLISVFPPEEQRNVRMRLAANLVSTISQRLIRRVNGKGLVAALEVMISNSGIAECISDPNRTMEISDYIYKSHEVTGGQTFDQHLIDLYRLKVISKEVAKEASSNPSDFARNLMYGENSEVLEPEGNSGSETGVELDHPDLTAGSRTASSTSSALEQLLERKRRKGNGGEAA